MIRKFIITAPVVDLRGEPQSFLQKNYSHQNLRYTQLLFGEKVTLLNQLNEWIQVKALEQIIFDESQGWIPYTGWILHSEAQEVTSFPILKYAICTPNHVIKQQTLSYGTCLDEVVFDPKQMRVLPKTPQRSLIIEDALLFIGTPYLWGGRSFHLNSTISSVDCSGLINLLYRAQGIFLPRNAHDQYLKCRPTCQLQPGDPLYLAGKKRIQHVVLKLDKTTFIEAPRTGQMIRLLKWGKEIWEENGRVHIFDHQTSYLPYPGSFFKE